MTDATRDAYVQAASARYPAAHDAVDEAVTRAFPSAERVFEWGMPMWRIPRPPDRPRPEREGTIPSDLVMVGLVERKAGLTLHLWYPGDYFLLDKHKDACEAAGLKVMRGCLQFNRKGEFPLVPVERVLAAVRLADAGAAHGTS